MGAGARDTGPGRGGLPTDAWADTQPIRAVIFGAARFEEHATSLADSHIVVARSARVVPLLTRLKDDAAVLSRAYTAILDDVRADREITPAAEWILDNYHVVETQVRQIRRDLSPDYFRQLPKLGPGFLEGHPRIFAIMWAYVAHTDSLLDLDLLATYVRAYEQRTALSLGELWAVAITLRLLYLENLRRLVTLIVDSGVDRRRAEQVADRLLGAGGTEREPVGRVIPGADDFRPSRAFAVRLLQRLDGQQAPEATEWLLGRVAAQGQDADRLVVEEHRAQSAATVTMSNIFTSLRLVSTINWEDWVESVSLIEEELRSDDGYAALDFKTRNRYRSAIEDLARGSGQQEIDVARSVLLHARHAGPAYARDPGYWLIDEGRRHLSTQLGYRPTWRARAVEAFRAMGLVGYLGSVTVATWAILLAVLWLVVRMSGGLDEVDPVVLVGFALLASVPISDLALGVVNYTIAGQVPAHPLPGLAMRGGIPEPLRTLVAIPALFTSSEEVDDLVDRLEVHYLANSEPGLYFGLVADGADSTQESTPLDAELLARATAGIDRLNEKYGGQFLLFHRPRRFNAREGVWMGHERKRGKLEELNRLLCADRDTDLALVAGRLPGPFRYVITLDSDTRLPREAARRLIGKIAHPLNRVVFEPTTRRVLRGYGILQPRVAPTLPTLEGSSWIQRAYSTPQGMDPYGFAVSDVYQDLFGEGSFTGKGIYDIEAMTFAIDGRVPDNTLLSHDLLEGNYVRAGLVTDVEVVEDHPATYSVTAPRSHRWIRGDWQLLPWLTRRREGLAPLGRWKMLDNLRRSLSAPAAVAATGLAYIFLPAAAAATWFAVLAVSLYLPHLIGLRAPRLLRHTSTTRRSQLRSLVEDVGNGLRVGSLNLVLLAHQAWLAGDAVVRTLYRLLVSRRHLLEWTTAAALARGAQDSLGRYLRLMAGGLVAPAALLVVAVARGPETVLAALAPVLLWAMAPVVATLASRSTETLEPRADPETRAALRAIGRATWDYFDQHVTAGEHHLPPDNFQEDPLPVIAHRTSPTNIGLYLLATVTAHDLGWIGLREAVDRLRATLGTVSELGHYRGHLFNWIDTRTLQPLEPRYVSTVDSGNLAGHLLALVGTLRQWRELLAQGSPAVCREGVLDATAPLHPLVQAAEPGGDGPLGEALARLEEAVGGAGPVDWSRVTVLAEALGQLATPVGADLGFRAWSAVRTVRSLTRDVATTTAQWDSLAATIEALATQAESMVSRMDFGFLHDSRRSLLSVGFHVPSATLDESCYDLLASEARLASYVAVAKGDIRTRHWRLLGRSVTTVRGGAVLLSWSGSMFEYLMPPLVMRAPADSLLSRTERLAVRRQRAYTEKMGIPWGVSEAAYNARDVNYTYQYSPFGVPGLGLVRGLSDNLVIAPYATGLAAMVDPPAAVANFAHLQRLGAMGRYGFYEALDYTPARVPAGAEHAVVRCYMAHHQGMTIVAIGNVVSGGLMRDRFHAVPQVRATELLLQERAPREVPIVHPRRVEAGISRRAITDLTTPEERVFTGPETLIPTVHHLSNGRLSLTLTPAGGGQLRWQGKALTRWHPDRTVEEAGDHIFLTDERVGRTWSATPMPYPGSGRNYEARFGDERAVFHRYAGRYETDLEYYLSPEADAMVRRLTIRNRTRQEQRLSVTSYAELVLAAARDDDAHPVFSKMFVHTEFLPERDAVIAVRRRRTPEEAEVWAGQMIFTEAPRLGSTGVETDRARFLGRGHSLGNADQLAAGGRPTGTTGFVLDPIFSLNRRVRVPAAGQAQLHFWTFAAAGRQELIDLIDQHRTKAAYERVAALAWTQSQVELRHLRISTREASQFQVLAGHVTHPHPQLRLPAAELVRDASPQSDLWPLGISGDLPVVVLRIGSLDDTAPARQLLRAFELWRMRRFAVDLVLFNEESTSYTQELHHTLEALVASLRPRTGSADSTGRVYVVRADQVAPHTARALLASAAVILDAGRGDLRAQLPPRPPGPATEIAATTRRPLVLAARDLLPAPPPVPVPVPDLVHRNGYGGFSLDGTEYVTVLEPGESTPAPWTNVVANEQFGFLATAEGAGFTWWRNSRDNQLTPWRNDPVTATVSEAVYVRDDLTGVVATPTASPIGAGRHLSAHGFGYTRYEHQTGALRLELVHQVAGEEAVKVSRLRITNISRERRTATVTSYHELVLGQHRATTRTRLVSKLDAHTGALFVTNPWSTAYADQVVFVDLGGEQSSWTADRTEFLGPQGRLDRPLAVVDGRHLTGRTGPGLDPCAALRRQVSIPAGGTVEVRLFLGAAATEAQARDLVRRVRARDPEHLLTETRERWRSTLSRVQVQHSGAAVRRHDERLAALPVARVQDPREGGLLPGLGRIRLPRPTPGRHGRRARRPRARPQASAARRGPPVPRRRRAALVVAGRRIRGADPDQRRCRVARAGGGAVRHGHRGDRDPRGAGALAGGPGTGGGGTRALLHAVHVDHDRHPVRALRGRPRTGLPLWRARTAADGHRRLERRDEPCRCRRHRRERLARLVPPPHPE